MNPRSSNRSRSVKFARGSPILWIKTKTSTIDEYEHERLAIDLQSGSDQLRRWVDDGRSKPKDLDELALADEKDWRQERRAYLLY